MTTTRTVDAAGYDCGVTIHRPETEQDRHTAVLYLHGGGLLYGERDDLPRPYIDAFLAEGYTLLCLDYPLAPEVSVGVIHQAVLEGWLRLLEEEGVERYFLFGRSAGAYLALILAKSLAGQPVPQPAGVLDFYGYYDMADPFVTAPSPYYKTLPEVPRRLVERFFGGAPVTAGPKTQRFSLYIHARQQGAWKELLGGPAVEDPAWSLSPEDIRQRRRGRPLPCLQGPEPPGPPGGDEAGVLPAPRLRPGHHGPGGDAGVPGVLGLDGGGGGVK